MIPAVSERVVILAPPGDEADLACAILEGAGVKAGCCSSLAMLVHALEAGAGAAVLDEAAIDGADLTALADWVTRQAEWSDFPFVLLASQGGTVAHPSAAGGYLQLLRNVTVVARPFHPATFASIVESALRGRRRQYEARARLEELAHNRAKYHTLFNTIDEGLAVIEFLDTQHGPLTDYMHIDANPAYEANAGIPEIVGKRLREIVSPTEADAWAAIYREVLLTGQSIRFERDLVETGRSLELGAFRVGPAEQRQVAVLFKDITARKRADARLKELNETLEAQVLARSAERDRLWQLSQDMLARADYNGMMSAVSPAWERVLGWSEAELLSRGYARFMHPEDADHTLAAIARMASDGLPTSFENRIQTRDGGWKPIEWSVAPEPGGVNFIAVGRDMSAAKARAEELRLAQESLRQSQKLDVIGQLTGGVAHDFNNLLMAVLSSLALLRKRVPDDPALYRLIDNAVEGAERGGRLTQRMLAFARRQDLVSQPVDLGELVHNLTGLLERTLGPTWPIVVEAEEEAAVVLADPNQIELALINLAVNARDAMAGGGEVRIRTLRREVEAGGNGGALAPGSYFGLAVIDCGHGMDAATLERATEPFFTTKGVGKGTGLGLSMIHGLASQLGGAFELESEPGRGTTAALWLPATAAARPAAPAPAEVGAAPEAPTTLKVLAVDDDFLVLMNTVALLEDLGHQVLEAASGAAALELVRAHGDIDVLITDQAMPGMTGAQLVQEVAQHRPELAIVLATGYAELPPGFKASVVRLSKPFSQDELANALTRSLRAV